MQFGVQWNRGKGQPNKWLLDSVGADTRENGIAGGGNGDRWEKIERKE